ncbi:MAG: hypothetical protein ABIP50_01680 [Candidatus Saccharimonadales bacterium]
MDKPLIIIDLDNTLAASAEGFIEFSNTNFGTSITIADYDEDRTKTWGVSFEEAERRQKVMRDRENQRDYKPMEHANEVLNWLKNDYKLVILTSRRKEAETYTNDWLEQHYPGLFVDVIYSGFFEDGQASTGHLRTKGDQYSRLGASYVIDDYMKHCGSAAEVNVQSILYGNYPWNRIDHLPDEVTRCGSWLEIKEFFETVKK